jgi:HTH-type transcriptional regulator / antitoxin HigA
MASKSIQTEEEYLTALQEVERLFAVDDKSFDHEQISNLLNRIEAHEDQHYPIPQPNLANRISYYLKSRGFLQA